MKSNNLINRSATKRLYKQVAASKGKQRARMPKGFLAALIKLAESQIVMSASENSGWIAAHEWEQSELTLE